MIASPRDWLPVVLWTAAVILTAAAACLRPGALAGCPGNAGAVRDPGRDHRQRGLADGWGCSGALARVPDPHRAPRAVAAASVLAFTALLSGLVNLDVAVSWPCRSRCSRPPPPP